MSFITWESESPSRISAANRMGLGDMLDEVIKDFPEDADTAAGRGYSENCHCGKAKCRKIISGQQAVWERTG